MDTNFSFVESLDLNQSCIHPIDKKYYHKSEQKDLQQNKDTFMIINKLQRIDNMPCVKSEGFFPLPIHRPDSTVKYTLLIKKY
ncbi:hypothetical protein SDC9_116769 [bioreactor metagenome]|uniref:Uncharacterized protein n=1 Tax=bioreactor metagenome TaxID=1076179 RepID=A0A645BYT5_9ZZZZ